jgi:glycosyltransferase involved in cell wall biosynthesis
VPFPTRALRSLHLDAGRAWRGGQRQVFLLARELRARGAEPLVVGVRGAPLLERAQAAGLATAAASMRADWDLRSAKRVRAIVRTWRPDVVHAHDARSHAIALIALAGDSTPLVVTRRVTFSLKAVRVKYGPRVNRYVAISQAVKAAMVRDGISPQRIDVVHSGVPSPVVKLRRDWRTELRWPADTVVAGVVGAMTAEKGLEQLFHMAAWLPDDAIERTRVVLLGGHETGPTTIGPLRAWRAGFVHEIYDAMAGLDVLWHPSTEEGLGTALIDALALRVPPVAYSVGGVPEIVQNGVNGLLVPPGDVHAFATSHVQMLAADTRGRLGAAGPERAGLFSVARMTDGIEQVYHRVLTS